MATDPPDGREATDVPVKTRLPSERNVILQVPPVTVAYQVTESFCAGSYRVPRTTQLAEAD